MKTKIFFLALAASLLILSGCSKKDKNTFSWTNQLKTCENYIGQDSATVIQQLIKDGFVLDTTLPVDMFGTVYAKVDSVNLTAYCYGFEFLDSKKVCTAGYTVLGSTLPDEVVSTDAFVELVKSIGASYTSAFGTAHKFSDCSYNNTQGKFEETDYAKFENNLETIANYNSETLWEGSNESEISITRVRQIGLIMRVLVYDGNVK